MPAFDSPDAGPPLFKGMLLGDSKAGKTGALLSLILAGYRLRVLDWDNNISILRNLIFNAVSEGKLTLDQARDRLRFVSPVDKFRNIGGKAIPTTVRAWADGIGLLSGWKEGKKGEEGYFELPPIEQWTPDEVLVVDTLWSAGKAALLHVVGMNNRLVEGPRPMDYNLAQQQIDAFLQLLKAVTSTNVLVLSHIQIMESTIGGTKMSLEKDLPLEVRNSMHTPLFRYDDPHGYAAFGAGKAISKDIAKYFGSVLLVKSDQAGKRWIFSDSSATAGLIELGTSNPKKVPPKLPLDTGLAEVFKVIRGRTPGQDAPGK